MKFILIIYFNSLFLKHYQIIVIHIIISTHNQCKIIELFYIPFLRYWDFEILCAFYPDSTHEFAPVTIQGPIAACGHHAGQSWLSRTASLDAILASTAISYILNVLLFYLYKWNYQVIKCFTTVNYLIKRSENYKL